MGMKKLRTKMINDPIFGGSFFFCIGDIYEFAKLVKKKADFEIDTDSGSDAKNVFIEDGYNFLWLERIDVYLLVHEIIHRMNVNLEYVGIPLSEDTSEVYAYYGQYLFEQCSNFLNQINEKKKTTKSEQS